MADSRVDLEDVISDKTELTLYVRDNWAKILTTTNPPGDRFKHFRKYFDRYWSDTDCFIHYLSRIVVLSSYRVTLPKINIPPSFYTNLARNEGSFFNAMAPTGQSSTEPLGPRESISELTAVPGSKKSTMLAEENALLLILWVTEALFKNRNTLPERTFDHAMSSCKTIVKNTENHFWIRSIISVSIKVWASYKDMFDAAIPVLETQSFVMDEPATANTNSSSAALMALNHSTLMKDLDRLNDLVLLARNILATTSLAQDFAAEHKVDKHVLRLVDICVRVTARGYDGDAGGRSETQWANVVGSYKKLLVTSLQFLYNFVQKNERRKLTLWLDLFDNSCSGSSWVESSVSPSKIQGLVETGRKLLTTKHIMKTAKDRFRNRQGLDPSLLHLDATRDGTSAARAKTREKEAKVLADAVNDFVQMKIQPNQDVSFETETPQTTAAPSVQPDVPERATPMSDPTLDSDLGNAPTAYGGLELSTPQEAAVILQRAKDHLMDRLQDNNQPMDPLQEGPIENDQEQNDSAGFENENAMDGGRGVQDSDMPPSRSTDEENTNKYRGPGDQARGLLTDIPLVLSPSEIEALPLLIQLGTVLGEGLEDPQDVNGAQEMQSVRCNILLTQDSGRNLLRELLIFIAAWDLQDDDLYFKIMMSIMESVLNNSLMPFAYYMLGEDKDIVSPAQSMVVKILTQIFRSKQGLPPGSRGPPQPIAKPNGASLVDVEVISHIFSNFRSSIIPETCALIYLQGQIRAGSALSDDFPLNLWDMERVYEGVYQFLEFFAVLTESEEWKNLLVEREIVYELITLLRELDMSIPKAALGPLPQTTAEAAATMAPPPAETHASSSQAQTAPAPVAVERPYDQIPPNPNWPSTEYADGTASETPSAAIDNQDPWEFEWRNLKKLVVLVLSSLVWKSTTVQNQIRQFGGVEMVLACCNFDHNNPYIREHAIMCLRFLLESNLDNQEIVRALEPKRAVPDEVLDKRGYETYIDDKGKVGLRAKEGAGP